MADAAAGQLQQAQELFQAGQLDRAEEIVARLVRESPRDATALNFRAYLLYRRGKLDEAVLAYRRLAELEPRVPGHLANLGLVSFKAQRYPEAQEAYDRLLVLQPDEPKALRNLGFCREKTGSLEQALDCFNRAGDEPNATRIRAELLREDERRPRPQTPAAGRDLSEGAAGPRSAPAVPVPAAPRRPPAAAAAGVAAWLEERSLRRPGEGPDVERAGPGELLLRVRDAICVNPAFCVAHRGVIAFAPLSRDAAKAASRFGDKRGVLLRAEGNGELALAAAGLGLYALTLAGERLWVNYGALVACGAEVDVRFEGAGGLKGAFGAVGLAGEGAVLLAVRGAPLVLPVPADLPTLARPQAVVAWTEHLAFEPEIVGDLRKLLSKDEALRYRFEGRGYLVLQSC